MKRIIFIGVGCMLTILSFGQVTVPTFVNNPYPKTISVSGSAMMEIVPDEIYVNIELQEYQKKGESKKDLETLKSSFLESCRTIGLPDSVVSIAAYSGETDYYSTRKKKKDPDLKAGIIYQVKFNNSKQMDDLIQRLDDEATKSFTISSISHSRIIEIRRQLKIKAVQAAKEKGIYLTEAIGEKLGEAISVAEPNEFNPWARDNARISNMNSYFSNSVSSEGAGSSPVDFKKLRLDFSVNVVFALK